jgi:hypothetical protein
LTKRLTELETKEKNLLDLVEDGGTIASKVRGGLWLSERNAPASRQS